MIQRSSTLFETTMSSINAKTYESTASTHVAFIGMGVMGYPMAGHLATAGHAVTVYNRSPAKAEAWVKEFAATKGPKSALTPREAAKGASIVFCCVGNDDDLRSVVFGADGMLAGMEAGTVLVDHTTASADVAREIYTAAKNLGIHFIDAPVSGGQGGAQNGLLTVMCGGDAPVFERVKPVAMAFSRAFTGPTHQDGESDLYRRLGARLERSHCLWPKSRPRHEPRARRDWQRCRAKLANGQPWQNHGGRQV
jgi:6-phosphogluconate dehydrogenase (decarboxylating)